MTACPICTAEYVKRSMRDTACSTICKIELKRQRERKKAERESIRARKEAIKPLSYWADKAQAAVNAYVRERDALYGCISCGTHAGKMNAGHYRSRGAMPALRYHLDNLHKQCNQCNENKAGNVSEYRIRLRQKIGDERLEWLEGPHAPARWRKEDYQAIESEHKEKLRVLKAARESNG